MYCHVPSDTRNQLDEAQGEFARIALNAAGLPLGTGEPIHARLVGPVAAGEGGISLAHITRGHWLDGIVVGHDVLTRVGGPHLPAAPHGQDSSGEFESMGALGDRTDDGNPILELRRMPKSIGHADWGPFAELLFRTVRAVNGLPYGFRNASKWLHHC
ncbi:hypothetical protein SHKM778_46800 [Streptomyces sp. KM77-8]|uniref:Uncharacterized protein n=1 Tax=Streptomyces haneummycinicus TaxID=3074435 RepID=A0AAT9HL79_9ACTN